MDRFEKIDKEINDLVVGKKNTNEVVVDISDDVLDEDPYDPRYFVDERNKVEIVKYIEQWIRGSFEYYNFIIIHSLCLTILKLL